MSQLTSLFKPIKVGSMELKNRVIMSSFDTGYWTDTKLNDRVKAFYAERAKGGVGLIFISLWDQIRSDEYLPALRELTDLVHANGAKISAQLITGVDWSPSPDKPKELVGPSGVAPSRGGLCEATDRPLSIAEIEQILGEVAEWAERAKKTGFDAVELHAHGGVSLASRFVSPCTNKRTDRYGGSLENRWRFFTDMLAVARQKVGKDFPISCRISGEDFMVEGNTLEDTVAIAPILEKAGFDAINIATGWHYAAKPFFQISVKPGSYIYMAEAVKKAVNIPVIGGIKVVDPVMADQFITDGKVDMVFMCRSIIADPEMPNKAQAGRLDEICPCWSCTYCFDLHTLYGPIGCSINTRVGKESEWVIKPAPKPKKVLVVGGGPAGMEAARVAALRGHQVTLIDKKDKLGGTLNIAAIPPFKEEDITRVIKYYTRQMEKQGVKVKLNQEITPEAIQQDKPDAVILAAGASPIIPDIPGVKGNNVVTALDVLTGAKKTGDSVVIIGGGMVGCETAEYLAEKGKKVTVLEMEKRVGNDIGPTYRWVITQRLRQAGIKLETLAKAEEITDKGVKAIRNDASELFEGDTVVLAVGMKPNDELSRQLQGKVASLYSVGNCAEPHAVPEAVESGFKVGMEV